MEAPEWVKEQWAKQNKNMVADLFSKVNFNQDIWLQLEPILFAVEVNTMHFKTLQKSKEAFKDQLTIMVKKKQLVELNVEEGWFSESEMKKDLHWSQC